MNMPTDIAMLNLELARLTAANDSLQTRLSVWDAHLRYVGSIHACECLSELLREALREREWEPSDYTADCGCWYCRVARALPPAVTGTPPAPAGDAKGK